MLCLFDRAPPELKSLRFQLPPHQQTFSIGSRLTNTELEVPFKPIYTEGRDKKLGSLTKPFKKGEPFDWDSRFTIVEDFAKMAWATTQEIVGKDKFKESNPTSSLMALQLNEPIYMLDIAVSLELVEWVHEFEDDPTQFQFRIPRFPTERYKPPHLPVPPSREIDVRQTIQHSWSQPPNVPPPHLHFQTEDVHITDQPKFTLKVFQSTAQTTTSFQPTVPCQWIWSSASP